MPVRFDCFVTGTDTEIGKTLASAALLTALAGAGYRRYVQQATAT
ncbi:AAA family ATPase, partial [Ralstonia pseudosolanacearum]